MKVTRPRKMIAGLKQFAPCLPGARIRVISRHADSIRERDLPARRLKFRSAEAIRRRVKSWLRKTRLDAIADFDQACASDHPTRMAGRSIKKIRLR